MNICKAAGIVVIGATLFCAAGLITYTVTGGSAGYNERLYDAMSPYERCIAASARLRSDYERTRMQEQVCSKLPYGQGDYK